MNVIDLQYAFTTQLDFEGDGVDDFESYSLHLEYWTKDSSKPQNVSYDLTRSEIDDMIEGAKRLIKDLEVINGEY